jgi:predicted nucleic acid-binding protein
MDVESLFIDTNILIHVTNTQSPWQKIAEKTLIQAKAQNIELVISPQILREYLAAATRLTVLNDNDISFSMIIENIKYFQEEFTVVEDNQLAVLNQLMELVQTIATAGKQIHDANIVATMLVHDINHLLTHNTNDFKRFSQFIQILPLEDSKKVQ